MKYTAVSTGLTITVIYAKNWLKVDDATDNTLITDLIAIAKEIADNFLQNDFRNVYDEEVGIGDDSNLAFALDNKPIQDKSLKLYVLYAGTDIVLAKANPDKYGSLQIQDDDDANNDYVLDLTTGAITFEASAVPDEGEIVYAYRYRLTTAVTIPSTVKMGVLKMIAYLYESRTGGVQAENVQGLGSTTWMKVNGYEIPPDVAALWATYRKHPGL